MLTTVAFTVPQKVMAGGYNHHKNSHHNGIRVNQQVNQQNQCSGQIQEIWLETSPQSGTSCINEGNNSATIHN